MMVSAVRHSVRGADIGARDLNRVSYEGSNCSISGLLADNSQSRLGLVSLM